jgi:hypothetical protein
MTRRFQLFGFLFLISVGASVQAQNPCPPLLPGNPTCYSGQDENRAYYLIAVPEAYNGRLVLWNHGYSLSPPAPLTQATDLGFPVVLLAEGFAVAASSYRPDALGLGGWAVADASIDTDNLRLRFIDMFGRPSSTYVVGASEGGIITAEIAEQFGVAEDGSLNYDGSLPMCGPLAGGRRNYYGAFDLRVVYQYYCQNLPRPDEPQYPLYLGLAPDDTLTPDQLASRVNECTGILLAPEQRTPAQVQNLANILGVTKIPASFLITDLSYATFAMRELVQVRAGGHNPVTNLGVFYTGSTDDDALNAGVYRAGSDPDGLAYIISAYDPTGAVPMPTLTMHTTGDGLVIVENERAYRETLEAAGTDGNLFQTISSPVSDGHCAFSLAEFEGGFHSLLEWVQSGNPPTQQRVADLCEQYRPVVGGMCSFNPEYEVQPFESRVLPRDP